MEQEGIEAHKHAKNEYGQYPAILTKQTLVDKEFFAGHSG